MEIENKSTLTQQDFAALAAAWRACKSPVHAMLRMQRVCFALAGLALAAVGGMGLRSLLAGGAPSLPLLLLDGALIAAGIAVVFFPTGRSLAEKAWRSYPEKGIEQVYRFTEEQVLWQGAGKEKAAAYSAVQDFLEGEGQYLLFFPDGTAHILHKGGFTAGDATSFCRLITERTGLAPRPLSLSKNRKG